MPPQPCSGRYLLRLAEHRSRHRRLFRLLARYGTPTLRPEDRLMEVRSPSASRPGISAGGSGTTGVPTSPRLMSAPGRRHHAGYFRSGRPADSGALPIMAWCSFRGPDLIKRNNRGRGVGLLPSSWWRPPCSCSLMRVKFDPRMALVVAWLACCWAPHCACERRYCARWSSVHLLPGIAGLDGFLTNTRFARWCRVLCTWSVWLWAKPNGTTEPPRSDSPSDATQTVNQTLRSTNPRYPYK